MSLKGGGGPMINLTVSVFSGAAVRIRKLPAVYIHSVAHHRSCFLDLAKDAD